VTQKATSSSQALLRVAAVASVTPAPTSLVLAGNNACGMVFPALPPLQKLHLKETGLQSEVMAQRGGRSDAQSQVRKLQCDIAELADAISDPKVLRDKVGRASLAGSFFSGRDCWCTCCPCNPPVSTVQDHPICIWHAYVQCCTPILACPFVTPRVLSTSVHDAMQPMPPSDC
jgi:hypothetical protein